jgi:hypothetical protein
LQEGLGRKIGGVTRQDISGMELDHRPVGREMAKRLAEVLSFDYRLML